MTFHHHLVPNVPNVSATTYNCHCAESPLVLCLICPQCPHNRLFRTLGGEEVIRWRSDGFPQWEGSRQKRGANGTNFALGSSYHMLCDRPGGEQQQGNPGAGPYDGQERTLSVL